MTVITWEGSIDAAHFIPGHPKCGRLHGHTYKVSIVLEGEVPLGHPAYLIDFAEIKKIVFELDHRLLLPGHHAKLALSQGEQLHVDIGEYCISMPINDAVILPIRETSSELISQYLARKLFDSKGSGYFSYVEVKVSETPNTSAVYSLRGPQQGAL